MEQLFYGSPPKVRPGPGPRDQVWTNERPALPGPWTNHRPRVTGTWVSRQAARSIAVPDSQAIHEFLTIETGHAGAACSLAPQPQVRSRVCRAGPGPAPLYFTSQCSVSGPPRTRPQPHTEISKLHYRSPQLSVQLSLFSDTQRGQLSKNPTDNPVIQSLR